jgi:hypothetical protein
MSRHHRDHRDEKFGNGLAKLGAWIDCLRSRESGLVSDLKELLSEIPLQFVFSELLTWREQKAEHSSGACEIPATTSRRARLQNLLTVHLTILRRPRQSNPCPSDPSEPSCPTTSSKKCHAPKPATASSTSTKKSKSKKKSHGKEKKLSVKPISAADVQELYKKLTPKLKGGCSPCNGGSSSPAPSCPQEFSCPANSSTESCEPVECAKACVPCPKHLFPRLIPYAVIMSLQFTRLRGTLNQCDSVLVHKFKRSFLNKIEKAICAAGINFRGGFLSRLPTVTTASFAGYGNRGYVQSLIGLVDFKAGTATVGQQDVNTVFSVPRKVFGRYVQPTNVQPQYSLFGLGNRSDILTSFFNIQIIAELSQIPLFAQLAREDALSLQLRNNPGGNGGCCNGNLSTVVRGSGRRRRGSGATGCDDSSEEDDSC